MERIHEGILYQDQHKRYCLYEPGAPAHQRLTCTSGCRLEVWLNRTWIVGHVEGDGEDYWLFADAGGRFLLAEHMKARYTEYHWRSSNRDISSIRSSSSIRLMVQRQGRNQCQITETYTCVRIKKGIFALGTMLSAHLRALRIPHSTLELRL